MKQKNEDSSSKNGVTELRYEITSPDIKEVGRPSVASSAQGPATSNKKHLMELIDSSEKNKAGSRQQVALATAEEHQSATLSYSKEVTPMDLSKMVPYAAAEAVKRVNQYGAFENKLLSHLAESFGINSVQSMTRLRQIILTNACYGSDNFE